jgi:hypothetical protein
MFVTLLTNINDQRVLGVVREYGSKKIVETLKQIKNNVDVAWIRPAPPESKRR